MRKPNYRFRKLHSVADIVSAMIKGLENEWVKVDMNTYGSCIVRNNRRICIGCAATNTLCELMQEEFKPNDITYDRVKKFNYDITQSELDLFECVINDLRLGDIATFMTRLRRPCLKKLFSFELPKIKKVAKYDGFLPILGTNSWKKRLVNYKKFLKWLRANKL